MKTLILLLNLLLAFCYVNDGVPANHESRSSAETASIASCPDPNAVNHSIMEDFLTKPAWDERREAVNVKNVSVSQITLLTDSSDNNACTLFNDTFQEVLDEESSLGDKIYDVTYYKAGSFYFCCDVSQSACQRNSYRRRGKLYGYLQPQS